MSVAVLGAGLAGCGVALELAERGEQVLLVDRRDAPMQEASRWCEGKIHLGFVYANDASFRTARAMIDGALRFTETLERWVDLSDRSHLVSGPFEYAIPRDSMLPVDQIEAHFRKVEAHLREKMARERRRYLVDFDRPVFEPADPAAAGFDPQHVAACFTTVERAIDASLLADRIRAAVEAHPRVDLAMGVDVERVEPRAGAHRIVGLKDGRAWVEGPFRQLVNALWANREVIDARMGRASRRRSLNRLKLGVTVWACQRGIDIPSTTFVLGPYGDVVRFPSGRSYLCWYPAGMIDAIDAKEPVDWRRRLAGVDHGRVIEETLAGLKRLAPGLEPRMDDPGVEVVVEGGAIFARGATDIDDIDSELHQRFEIGPRQQGGYVSLDTGKLTTAPQFALQAADMIRPRTLAIHLRSA